MTVKLNRVASHTRYISDLSQIEDLGRFKNSVPNVTYSLVAARIEEKCS